MRLTDARLTAIGNHLSGHLLRNILFYFVLVFSSCAYCTENYTFILKAETFNEDLRFLGMATNISFPYTGKHIFIQTSNTTCCTFFLVTHVSSGGSTERLAHEYFSLLDQEAIKKLYDLYKIDFELFDYNHVDYLQMAKDYQ